MTAVWRAERRARWSFTARLQGALGTGAGYVALLLLAYEQLGSAWGAWGAVREIGQLIGPAVAAGVMLVAEPELVLVLNAVTFAVSAAFMTRLAGHVQAATRTAVDDEVPAPAC